MKSGKAYARGKHAITEAQKYAPHAILKVFKDEKGEELAQISLSRLVQPYEEFAAALTPSPSCLLVLLAGVEDPHNVGAIIRSAAALGAAGVLLSDRSPLTDAVLKVSAGMAFRVPLVAIGSGYQQALSDLRKRGFAVFGLEASGRPVMEELFEAPVVLVFGNEGEGLPGAVRPLLSSSLSIPMHRRAESLNVAAAAAAVLFAWSARHPEALK